jgi:hypothetical protein
MVSGIGQKFGFPPYFLYCFIFISICILFLSEGQTAKAWELSRKTVLFWKPGELETEIL